MFTCYVTANDAGAFIKAFRGTAAFAEFSGLPVDDQTAALMGAQLLVDAQRYRGQKSDPDQAEAFPRLMDGKDIGIPQAVQVAVSLQAYAGISGESEAAQMAASLKAAGVTRYHIDDFDVAFDGSSQAGGQLLFRDGLTEDVYRLLFPYLDKGGVAHVVR